MNKKKVAVRAFVVFLGFMACALWWGVISPFPSGSTIGWVTSLAIGAVLGQLAFYGGIYWATRA